MKKKQPTIKDVARVLGISKSTVSRALRGDPHSSPDTVKKVVETARSIGYQPNLIAQGLKNQRTNIIGIIVPEIERPYYASLTSSVQQFALKHDFHTVICQSKDSVETEKDVLFTLLSLQVEGILMVHSKETSNFDHIQQVINRNIPIILIDRSNDAFDIPRVENDHYAGGFMVGQHLAQMGCKNISIIGGPRNLKMSNLRIDGCIAGASNEGVAISTDNIYYGDFNREKTLTILDKLLANSSRPDALFCVYDRGALEILKQLEFRNISVPEDIAVAGFGNETMSRYVIPALTTVDQDPSKLGELGVGTLLQQILCGMNPATQHYFIKPELIIRDSTRKAALRNVKRSHHEMDDEPCKEATVINTFKKIYGIPPAITVRAPGSIIMTGDHTDHYGGILLGASVDKDLYISLSESPDESFRFQDIRSGENYSGTQCELKGFTSEWMQIVIRSIEAFQSINFPILPFQLSFCSNITAQAGLYASTAFQCGLFYALNAHFDLGLTKSELIRLAHSTDCENGGRQTGIMSKYTCMLGKKGGFLKLDSQSKEFEYIPFPYEKHGLALCDAGVVYGPGGGENFTRIREAREAMECIREKFPAVGSFREVGVDMLTATKGLMQPAVYMRAAAYLEKVQLPKFGKILYESHQALQTGYQISCPELDFLVDLSSQYPGVAGAKMIGEGYGGSMLAVVKRSSLQGYMEQVNVAYLERFGFIPNTCQVSLSNGVSIVSV